jgi:hypothetical protein
MVLVVVERTFPQPVAFDEVQAMEEAVAWCLQQHDVRFLHSYCSLDRLRMVCVYEAPDAEAVRTVNRTGGLPFDRVWTADLVEGGGRLG